MSTLLVTGGAGFIGSDFIEYELRNHPGLRVVCFDKLTYAGNLMNLEGALGSPDFRFLRGDVADSGAVERVFNLVRPDAVVNFAAESHVDRSIEEPELFLRTNVMGTQVLLDACRRHCARFHQVSTDEVYGDLPLERPDLRFSELSPLRASSPYSASKAGADLLCLAYHRTYGLPVTVSRCSNNYGPRQFPEKLIPLMLSRAAAGLPMPVYGTGLNVRDWIYVEDHCRAIDMILAGGQPGKVYNIGADCEKRNIDIVRSICRALGRGDSLITYVADRPGHDLRYAIDSSLIRSELGWRPLTDFDTGLAQTIRWYGDNSRWLQSTENGEYTALNAGAAAV